MFFSSNHSQAERTRDMERFFEPLSKELIDSLTQPSQLADVLVTRHVFRTPVHPLYIVVALQGADGWGPMPLLCTSEPTNKQSVEWGRGTTNGSWLHCKDGKRRKLKGKKYSLHSFSGNMAYAWMIVEYHKAGGWVNIAWPTFTREIGFGSLDHLFTDAEYPALEICKAALHIELARIKLAYVQEVEA